MLMDLPLIGGLATVHYGWLSIFAASGFIAVAVGASILVTVWLTGGCAGNNDVVAACRIALIRPPAHYEIRRLENHFFPTAGTRFVHLASQC